MKQRKYTIKIKNDPQSVQGKKFVGKREQQRILREKAIRKFIAIVLVAGTTVSGFSAIQKMQSEANKSKNTKEAIKVANATEHYLENMASKNTDYRQKIEEIDTLTQRFAELANNDSRTVAEEQEFMEVTKNLYCSRNDVIKIRRTLLKTEIAQAYGITDPNQIAAISFEYKETLDHSNGKVVDYVVTVPKDKFGIEEDNLDKYEIDSKLKAEIEDIDSLSYSAIPDTTSMTMEQLEAGAKEVYTYYSDIDYEKDYNIRKTKGVLGIIGNGHLKSVEDKEADHNER